MPPHSGRNAARNIRRRIDDATSDQRWNELWQRAANPLPAVPPPPHTSLPPASLTAIDTGLGACPRCGGVNLTRGIGWYADAATVWVGIALTVILMPFQPFGSLVGIGLFLYGRNKVVSRCNNCRHRWPS